MSILDSHPEIHVIPFETSVLQSRPIEKRVFRTESLHYFFTRIQLGLYLFSGKIKSTAIRWSEKTPLNILNTDEIRRIYRSKVQFINIVRDGRDVVSSYHKRLGYMVRPELWMKCVEAGQENSKLSDCISIRYEDLVNTPNETLAAIQDFLSLEEPFNVNTWTASSEISRNRSLINGKKMVYNLAALNAESIGKWEKSFSPWLTEFLKTPRFLEKNRELGYD